MPVRLLSAAVCALGAHALLYGTFRPGDGLHGYNIVRNDAGKIVFVRRFEFTT